MELFLKGAPIASEKFRWEMSLTAANQWDKIIRLYPGITQINSTSMGVDNRSEEGKRMGRLYMRDYVKDDQGRRVVGSTGYYQLSEEAEDRICVGSINPDVIGGFNTNFYFNDRWGGMLNLMCGLDYRFGGKVLSITNYYLVGNGLIKSTLPYRDAEHGGKEWEETTSTGTRMRHDGVILPGVKSDGSENDIVITALGYYSSYIHDTGNAWQPDMIQDNDYIKVREMALSYTFPSKWCRTLRLQKLSLGITARNLFYLHKTIENIDVESTLGTNSWVEYSAYPSTRNFGFKINLSF